MHCCSAQESKMDYKRRFLLGGSKQKVQQHQQYQMPELSRTFSAPLASATSSLSSSTATGVCTQQAPNATPVADIQQGISKYLDALNVFCRASTFLTDLFSNVFRNSHYSKVAMQLKDVQEHVMEAASRLTAAIKPEIAKMLMELSVGAANFKDQNEFSLQDIEVLGRCFLTVMQVHFQFLSQALQKVQPVAQSCFAETLAQERRHTAGSEIPNSNPATESDEAVRSWKGAAEATSRLRDRGHDACLAGIEVQQFFCSRSTSIPEHHLKEFNIKIDNALQAYKLALDSLGHCEYALKAGFHLNPKAIEMCLHGCCSDAEAQQAGRRQTPSQPIQCELPTVPVQIGSHFLKGISFNESATENLKFKMQTMLQLIKEAAGQNGITPRDDTPVTEVMNQVCPSTWRGACKTAVQLLFGQAGLVVVDTAQVENKEAYAPQISLEGSKIVVQVPSTWCVKEDPATMSLLQRSLDPEKNLGLVDVLYTAVFDLSKWKEGREQALPSIQIQLQRESSDFGGQVDLPSGNGSKSSGLQKTFSKLTSRFTKKVSCHNYSVPNTPSKNGSVGSSLEEKAKMSSSTDIRLQSILNIGSFPRTMDAQSTHCTPSQTANGLSVDRRENLFKGCDKDEKGMNLPSDREMQDVIDFLSGFNMSKSQQTSPLPKRRNSTASASAAEQKTVAVQQPQSSSHSTLQLPQQTLSQQSQKQQQLQFYQHLLQPIGQQQRAPAKWPSSSQQQSQTVGSGLPSVGQIGQWNNAGLPDLSSDFYSLGLVSNYMDNVMSEMLGQKAQGPRNNTWPNRDQSEGVFGMLGDILPFDPAVGSDPEFARYVAGVSQAMQQKRHAQHVRRPSSTRCNWPNPDDPHRTWPLPEYFTEGKHSSGEQEASTLPSPPLLSSVDDLNQETKTKTWPPKAPWQHSSTLTNTLPSQSSLYQLTNPVSQWSDTLQILQSPVWSTNSDCAPSAGISSGFSYSQQQQACQQQQVSQHKPVNKGFKSFPLKHERRPSYLHQY
ncbi:granule associated Rac and RHOG effector protein 1 isoform X2 [Protopterus annectens]|uniref:granule associated Rac and RHOG effector protein 1 isoform X2 n=1 Tax=Protopterus annectens TaxID=7888 RepID=UPI001CFC29BD|nr:granule associated Rac and RHOG effector protein 1 isoform X2 [Protopterus annectens]